MRTHRAATGSEAGRGGSAFGNCAVQGDSGDRVNVLLQRQEQGPAFGIAGAQGGAPHPRGNSLPHPPWGSAAGEQLLGVVGLLSLPCARDKGQIGYRARRPQTGGAAESRRVPLKMGRGTPSCGFLSGGWLTHRLEAHGPTAPVP